MLGHTMGAASAIEAVACCLAIRDGMVPPTINFADCDPRCGSDCTPNKAREKKMSKAIIIARGRGGINMVLGVEKA